MSSFHVTSGSSGLDETVVAVVGDVDGGAAAAASRRTATGVGAAATGAVGGDDDCRLGARLGLFEGIAAAAGMADEGTGCPTIAVGDAGTAVGFAGVGYGTASARLDSPRESMNSMRMMRESSLARALGSFSAGDYLVQRYPYQTIGSTERQYPMWIRYRTALENWNPDFAEFR